MSNYPEVWVKPGPDRKVRLAGGGVVPADGMPVPKDHFIHKLILSEDLVEIDPPPATSAAAAKATPATSAAIQSGGTEVAASKSTGS